MTFMLHQSYKEIIITHLYFMNYSYIISTCNRFLLKIYIGTYIRKQHVSIILPTSYEFSPM